MNATPSVENVLQVLQAAAFSSGRSKDQAEHALRQLEQWQGEPGFHAILQSIGQSKAYPPATRILGLTQLKNGIDKHWRAGSSITTDEQSAIRSGLQQIDLDETDGRIVALTAVIFASIARRDFPNKWSSLFDDLVRLYSVAIPTQQHQCAFALKIIQKTITEFQTLRLALPRKAYFDAAPKLLAALASDSTLQNILSTPSTPSKDDSALVFHTVLVFKCIRRIAVGGSECPHHNDTVLSIWRASQHCLQAGMANQSFDNQWWMALMRQLVKFHLSMAQNHPITFALLEPTSLIHFYWDTALSLRNRQLGRMGEVEDALEDGLAPFFILRTLLLLRACFQAAHNTVHTMRFAKNRDPEEPSRAKDYMKTQVLTQDFVARMFEGLVGTYMMYAPGDIEEWTDEAEEWEIREYDAEDAYEQSVRPCAERLFLDITLWYKDLILQPLLQLAERYAPSDNVFIKDAVYSSLGIAASRIYEHFDFNHFLETQIVQDMANSAPNYNIIRRRIAILLAYWVPMTDCVSKANKDKVYAIYRSLLDPSDQRNDQVVRVTAGKRFKDIGDDFAFEAEGFRPYASDVLRHIVDLMIEVQLPENKLALLETLRCVVERMDTSVVHFADQIVGLLQRLWGEVEKEQLIKKAIVNVLAKLTGSLKGASAPLQSFVIPLLRQVLNPSSQENLYLWEDSLDLLHELIQQSKGPASPDLIRVSLDYMDYLDRTDGPNLGKLLEILESLLVLASDELIQSEDSRRALISILCPLMTNRNTSAIGWAASCFELLTRAAANLGNEAGAQALVDNLTQASFTKAAIDCILGCWSAHQTHGPNRRDPPNNARSETYFFIVLARVLLNSPSAFAGMISNAAQQRGAELQGILKRVMEEWFSHLDNVGNIAKTKLMVMALTRLLDLREPWILSRLQDYMSTWTSMLVELREDEEDKGGDTLVMPPYDPPQGEEAEAMSPENDRRMRLTHSDPVHTVNLSQFVKARVDAVVEQNGGFERFRAEWLVDVDGDVVQQFMSLF